MWVNICDACLSVFLVWLLIPLMGIGGYALVIIAMEAFNFAFSITRLYKRIPFKISYKKGFFLPLISAIAAVSLSECLFLMNGSEAEGVWFFSKLLFTACAYVLAYTLIKKIGNGRSAVTEIS